LNASLPASTRLSIENWAKQQMDKPSRSEAIRRLIETALGTKRKRERREK
jgi:metal-responsive CopG/Arc/MetJ family transcriptional regulator